MHPPRQPPGGAPLLAADAAPDLAGVPLLGVVGEPGALAPDEVAKAQADGAVVLDARSPEAFGAAHVPGALNVGLGSSFSTWAGTVLAAGAQVVLVLDRPADDLWEATWQLLRVGYAPPVGWLAGGMHAWRTSGRPFASLVQLSVHELHDRLAGDRHGLAVLDVRQPAEWAEGHIAGATFITGGELPGRLDDVPEASTVAVVCGSGYRSSVAASLLAAAGHAAVNVLGGMTAWTNAGYPVEQAG